MVRIAPFRFSLRGRTLTLRVLFSVSLHLSTDSSSKSKAFLNDLAARIGAGPPKKPVGLVKVPDRSAAEVEAAKEAEAAASAANAGEDSTAAKARAEMADILRSGPPSREAQSSTKPQ